MGAARLMPRPLGRPKMKTGSLIGLALVAIASLMADAQDTCEGR
jgi:hypothetical protein